MIYVNHITYVIYLNHVGHVIYGSSADLVLSRHARGACASVASREARIAGTVGLECAALWRVSVAGTARAGSRTGCALVFTSRATRAQPTIRAT